MKGSGTEIKQLAAALALLIFLLGCSLGNAWYAQRLTETITSPLGQAQRLARADRWEEAAKLTQGAYDNWNGHHFYLHAVLRHSDTDQILRSFRAALEYLKLEELDQYAAANADLLAQLELLAEMEQAALVNVLCRQSGPDAGVNRRPGCCAYVSPPRCGGGGLRYRTGRSGWGRCA